MKAILCILLVAVLLTGCSEQSQVTDVVESIATSELTESATPSIGPEHASNSSFRQVISTPVITDAQSSQPVSKQSESESGDSDSSSFAELTEHRNDEPMYGMPSALTELEPATPPQPTETPSPTESVQTQPAPTEPTPTEPVATEPEPTAPQQPTESAPTEPAGCQHDWICVRHEEEGHWKAGIICDCGWTVYGDPNELMALWNAHSASYSPEESLFEHGGCGCVDEWVVDVPAREEWYCRYCGEQMP